jgi:hypothetical protein
VPVTSVTGLNVTHKRSETSQIASMLTARQAVVALLLPCAAQAFGGVRSARVASSRVARCPAASIKACGCVRARAHAQCARARWRECGEAA